MTEERTPAYLEDHTLAADKLAFSLPDTSRELQAKVKPGGRSAITIVKQAGLSVVMMRMAPGNKLAAHKAPGPVTIQVVGGRVRVTGGPEEVDAGEGSLVAFGPGVEHSLEAVEDSSVLLSVVEGTVERLESPTG